MDIRRMDGGSAKWLLGAWVDRNLWFANGFQHAPSICGRVFKRRISVNCADAQEVQGWMMRSKKNSKGVLIRLFPAVN